MPCSTTLEVVDHALGYYVDLSASILWQAVMGRKSGLREDQRTISDDLHKFMRTRYPFSKWDHVSARGCIKVRILTLPP